MTTQQSSPFGNIEDDKQQHNTKRDQLTPKPEHDELRELITEFTNLAPAVDAFKQIVTTGYVEPPTFNDDAIAEAIRKRIIDELINESNDIAALITYEREYGPGHRDTEAIITAEWMARKAIDPTGLADSWRLYK